MEKTDLSVFEMKKLSSNSTDSCNDSQDQISPRTYNGRVYKFLSHKEILKKFIEEVLKNKPSDKDCKSYHEDDILDCFIHIILDICEGNDSLKNIKKEFNRVDKEFDKIPSDDLFEKEGKSHGPPKNELGERYVSHVTVFDVCVSILNLETQDRVKQKGLDRFIREDFFKMITVRKTKE